MVIYLIIIGIFILIKLIQNREKRINSSLIGFVPLGGYEDVDLVEYNGLKWMMQTHNTKYNPQVTYKDIYINPSPYCPKCNGKLKIKKIFYGTPSFVEIMTVDSNIELENLKKK